MSQLYAGPERKVLRDLAPALPSAGAWLLPRTHFVLQQRGVDLGFVPGKFRPS